MAYANISYQMPPAHLEEVKNALNVITTRLPFLVNLTPDERQAVVKLAQRDVEFINDMRFAVTTKPEIFPASFNAEEYMRDVNLYDILTELRLLLESLTEKVKFTEMALGGEVMNATNQGYHFVQAAAKTVPGMQTLAEKMKLRYKNAGRKPGQAAEPN